MSDASTHEPGSECRSCPVCLVLQALQEVRPEVRMHLVAAGRELVLALRAALAADMTSGEGERQRAGGWGSDGEGERQRAGGWGSDGEGERQRAGGWGTSDNAPTNPSGGVSGNDAAPDGERRRLRRIEVQ